MWWPFLGGLLETDLNFFKLRILVCVGVWRVPSIHPARKLWEGKNAFKIQAFC